MILPEVSQQYVGCPFWLREGVSLATNWTRFPFVISLVKGCDSPISGFDTTSNKVQRAVLGVPAFMAVHILVPIFGVPGRVPLKMIYILGFELGGTFGKNKERSLGSRTLICWWVCLSFSTADMC